MRIQAKNQPSEAHSLAEDSRGIYHDTNKKGGGRHTHFLETAEGGTCQATETKRPSEEHSLPGWRRERLVRTRRETNKARRTHELDTEEGGTHQDTQRKRPNEAHSLPGDDRGKNLSRHRKTSAERDALTSWRPERQGLVRTRK